MHGQPHITSDLLRQCVPHLCDNPGNTHVQSNTALRRSSTAYYTPPFSAIFTALALSTNNVGTSPHFPPGSPSRRFSQNCSLTPSMAAINSASITENATDRCSSLGHAMALPASGVPRNFVREWGGFNKFN